MGGVEFGHHATGIGWRIGRRGGAEHQADDRDGRRSHNKGSGRSRAHRLPLQSSPNQGSASPKLRSKFRRSNRQMLCPGEWSGKPRADRPRRPTRALITSPAFPLRVPARSGERAGVPNPTLPFFARNPRHALADLVPVPPVRRWRRPSAGGSSRVRRPGRSATLRRGARDESAPRRRPAPPWPSCPRSECRSPRTSPPSPPGRGGRRSSRGPRRSFGH
jgi:hypothetical protein